MGCNVPTLMEKQVVNLYSSKYYLQFLLKIYILNCFSLLNCFNYILYECDAFFDGNLGCLLCEYRLFVMSQDTS